MRLIDADELIRQADENQQFAVWKAGVGTLVRLVDTMPTIDPESLRPHGCWIQVESAWERVQHECSCCGCKWPEYARFFAYCPYCGAKMENTDES